VPADLQAAEASAGTNAAAPAFVELASRIRKKENSMAELGLSDISERLRDIDFVMLHTLSEDGEIAGRPMSNNRDVDYDGDSFYFVDKSSRTYSDVHKSPQVTLAAQGNKGLFGSPPIFISIQGEAEIIEDKSMFEEHWTKDLERWWPDGIDTPGLAMIKVHAERLHYWDGEDEGEIGL
jgi:general stress protein 26